MLYAVTHFDSRWELAEELGWSDDH